MKIGNAEIITPEGVIHGGAVTVEDGRIQEVSASGSANDLDLEGCLLLPGLVDIHTHPQLEEAADTDALRDFSRALRATGTGAFLFALPNVPVARSLEVLTRLRSVLDAAPESACAGIYLEGPYVSPEMRGAFSESAIATPADFPVESLIEVCGPCLRYINIAPELPGAIGAIRKCTGRGITVSMGHSSAGRECLEEAVAAGARTICHTFNASEIQRWKEPGVLDVTLDFMGLASEELVCEVICDGVHVDPLLLKLLYRAKGPEGIAIVTDSLLGGRDAEEGRRIHGAATDWLVEGGCARLPDGGLAGSTLTMARALRCFMTSTGCSLPDAVRMAAEVPARLAGIEADYGAVAPGRRAIFCVLDRNLNLRADLCRKVNRLD